MRNKNVNKYSALLFVIIFSFLFGDANVQIRLQNGQKAQGEFIGTYTNHVHILVEEKITEDLLIQKISYLVKKFNSNNFRFNIGHSQKLINILLKYYWCLGWLKNEPPHCPLDRIVLSKAQIKSEGKTPSWTKMDNVEDYKKYIKDIKKIADPKSVALWELEIFNRRD